MKELVETNIKICDEKLQLTKDNHSGPEEAEKKG